MKNLDTIFNVSDSRFTDANTIVVDDSSSKHILNKLENVVLLQSWSNLGGSDCQTYLLNDLFPWIQRLHECDDHGLLLFRKPNPIGCTMLCEDPNPQ